MLKAQDTPPSTEVNKSQDFEQFLITFYLENYNNCFSKACNLNKADVSFKVHSNGNISDLIVKSPRKDIDSFLKDGIELAKKNGKLV